MKMEIERYVIDTVRCFIYDLDNPQDVKKFEMISKYATHFVNGACKTSDNILDFVEVGDGLILTVDVGFLNGNNKEGLYSIDEEYDLEQMRDNFSMGHNCIIAILKRQPNGDYKRYEVKA